jgi:hypothetical protein
VKTSSVIWICGGLVAINALLAISLSLTWLSIYEMYSYPIDFFFPIIRTNARAILCLNVAAVTVPMGFFSYRRAESEMSSIIRVISLIINSGAATVVLAFVIWK